MSRATSKLAAAVTTVLAITAAFAATVAFGESSRPTAHAASPTWQSQCRDRYSARNDPSNPLMLATSPGGDPLRGARFFVDGPAHGAAAGAIARLLGIDTSIPVGHILPSFSESESWGTFAGFVARRLPHVAPAVARKIRLLEKIASQPEAQRVSDYSQGGTPVGIWSQTQKLFCHNFTADPGAIPIIGTDFLHAHLRGCPSNAQMDAYRPLFKAQIDAMARATGNRPAVYLLELDAIGSSSCIARTGGLGDWESLLRYESIRMASLPHTVVYLEGGYSDSNNARYAARILNRSGIRHVEGFFTNDTHLNWTTRELRYGREISRLTHGAHFVINTAANGDGPLLNPHPRTQGMEDLCNAPGRALGPELSTDVPFAHVDAFMWTHVPGNSSGCGGGPPGGTFWAARAIGLAARANDRIGPHSASDPY